MDNMKRLLELQKDISRIEDCITAMLAEAEHADNDNDIDFSGIVAYAEQSCFQGHCIERMDEEIVEKYIVALLSLTELLEKKEDKIRQYYFVARIFSAQWNIQLETLVGEAKLISAIDLTFLKDNLNEEEQVCFLFDALLMISLSGAINEKQLAYYCEMIAFFDIDKEVLSAIVKLVRGILTEEYQAFYECAGAFPFPVNNFSCYMKYKLEGTIISNVNQLDKIADTDIILTGYQYKGCTIDIDSYGKDNITFKNCVFDNVSNICAISTKVKFEDCTFKSCFREYELRNHGFGNSLKLYQVSLAVQRLSLFSFKNAEFYNCSFEDCRLINNEYASILLYNENGVISNCSFCDCQISATSIMMDSLCSTYSYDYGAIVVGNALSINQCRFIDCQAISSGRKSSALFGNQNSNIPAERQYVHIIYCMAGSSIEDCIFENCKCDGAYDDRSKRNNCMINVIGAMDRGNEFVDCKAAGNVGTLQWEISWNYDLSKDIGRVKEMQFQRMNEIFSK